MSEFWQRWHIFLSTWLRDYLYIPLGGNHKGRIRTDLNLMATMILGGLWHGAAWIFVLWGTLHGAALTFKQMFIPCDGIVWYHPFVIGIIFAVSIIHILHALNKGSLLGLRSFQLRSPVVLFTMLWLIVVFHPRNFNPFIYFQF